MTLDRDAPDTIDWRALPGQALRLSLLEMALVLVAWAALLMSAGALAALPFRWLAKLFGKHAGAISYIPIVNAAQFHNARLVQQAIRRAARLSPFRSDCLRQALAGATLCRLMRVPAAVHLGVKHEPDGTFAAHAMLHVGPVSVSGGNGFDKFAIISCFVRLGD